MSDTKDSPAPVPLLAAALGTDIQNVLLAYGNHLQPVMERVVSTQEAAGMCSVPGCNLLICEHTEQL